MCQIDYDPPSVYAVTTPKARKEYRCSEDGCDRTIPVGTRYTRVFGIWEGSPGTFRLCRKCSLIAALLKASKEPIMHGMMREALRDCYLYEGKDVLFRMRDAHRAGVGKEWRAAA